MAAEYNRKFLMLQGPHGPYFRQLGEMLADAGCDVLRVGFSVGDWHFWRNADTYVPFYGPLDKWDAFFTDLVHTHGITDIVLYGDTKPVHAQAVKIAKSIGLSIHVFEEGYLRPYWVSYERDGSNGNSRLMNMTVDDMRNALASSNIDAIEAPAHWGDMYHHVFYSFVYHAMMLMGNRKYKKMRTHRDTPVRVEFAQAVRQILRTPLRNAVRNIKTRRLLRGGHPYHIVLMQLEHDSAFQKHSSFETMEDFFRVVIRGFAEGAPQHHRLVFKAHPLEFGKTTTKRLLRKIAAEYGVENRVLYIPGQKLGRIMDHARTAITVNSTAAQQALWRGIPLKIFGSAVYDKPEFVSTASIKDFFGAPERPDTTAYRDYRRYLLETSQIAGGFYSSSGRKQLLRQVADMMLSRRDPYDAFEHGELGPRQRQNSNLLRVV